MKWLLFLAFGTVISGAACAQQRSAYNWAIGFRAGSTGATCGGTAKVFLSDALALEGMVGYWHQGFTGTLLLEYHKRAFGLCGLNWLFGGGAHFTQNSGYGNTYIVSRNSKHYVNGGAAVGVDGIFGLEYKIPVIPVALSVDIKPAAEINASGGFNVALDPGVGIKLAF